MRSKTSIGFKGGNVSFFLNLINDSNWTAYYLNDNYRCGEKIIDIANEVISQADDILSLKSNCKSGKIGNVIVDSKFKINNYLFQIKKNNDYKDWFFLVRTNKDIVKLEEILSKNNLPYISFKRGKLSLDEMRKNLAEDKIKLLTIHTAKGLESKNVLMWGNFPIYEKPYLKNNDEIKVKYVGITRAIENLIILN